MTELRSELAALRAEIRSGAHEADETPPVPAPPAHPEFEAMIADLRSAIAEAGEDTAEAVARHPAAALGAAFLLGIIVGRIAGRS